MIVKVNKTKIVTFRVEQEVYTKFRKKHPNVSRYLRDAMKREARKR